MIVENHRSYLLFDTSTEGLSEEGDSSGWVRFDATETGIYVDKAYACLLNWKNIDTLIKWLQKRRSSQKK